MEKQKSPKLKFNCYLLREDISEFESALRKKYRKGGSDQLQQLTTTSKAPQGAVALYGSTPPKSPKWAELLENSFIGVNQATNSAQRLLIFLPVAERMFVICFGYGSSALEWDAIETGFGLQVAARILEPDRLTELRSRRIDRSARTQEISIATGGTLEALGADVEGEYVRKLIGVQEQGDKEGLKGAIIAGDSIAFHSETSLFEVEKELEAMLRLVEEKAPAEEFSYIDAMEPLRADQQIVRSLKKLIEEDLFNDFSGKEEGEREFEKHFLEVAVPDDVRFEEIDEIKVLRGEKSFAMEELSIDELCQALKVLQVRRNTDFLKNVKLLAIKADGSPASTARPLLDWLIFEAGIDNDRYVLTLGKWFRFDRDFTVQLNKDLESIPDLTAKLRLPSWSEGKEEKDYCIDVTRTNPDFALFDRVRLKNSGTSMVEVCDLLYSEGHLIHVKRDGGASTLSHLFAQGEVSVLMLVYDDLFHKNFEREATSQGSKFTLAAQNAPTHVTYAIAHKNPERAPLNLPTFSKINLRSHINRLRGMKIEASIARIVIS